MNFTQLELCEKIEQVMLDCYVRDMSVEEIDVEVRKLNLTRAEVNDYSEWNDALRDNDEREANADKLRNEYREAHNG
jgi:hypothetical protein